MKQIGSTFPAELNAAGLAGLPFSWTSAGEITFSDSITQQQHDAVMDIYAAHNPKQGDIQSKWAAIKAERDRRTEQGGYKVGVKWFHSDQKSRSQQLGLALLGGNIQAGLQWKTMDGSYVTMTQTLAQQIIAANAANDQAIFAVAEAHKTAMESSADPASYDFSAGWPKVFGEEE